MTCETESAKPVIVKSVDKTLRYELKDANGEPLDLTPYTGGGGNEITACIDTETVTLTGGGVVIVTPNELGIIDVTIDGTGTSNMSEGIVHSEILLDDGGVTDIIQFENSVEVKAKLC